MGRACFLRVPVSEANDLNYLLCRGDEAGYASRLGNNDIKSMQLIDLSSVTKNRTPIRPNQPNQMTQRTAANMCMVIGFT
jgi:hypothetical protein